MNTEPVTRLQVTALSRMLGLGAILMNLDDVDYTRGRGEEKTDYGKVYYLWTKKGCRITISHTLHGEGSPSMVGSCAKNPDPNIPPAQYPEPQANYMRKCIKPECQEQVDVSKRKSGACCREHMNYECTHPDCVALANAKNWDKYTHPYGSKISYQHLRWRKE